MANPEHLQILQQGVVVWNRWRDRCRGIMPDLTKAHLTKAMLGPKQTVTLEGYPRRDGTREMRIERITAGGRTVELR